jgi:RNA polymerase sigma-70 factor (ECF subfamily)
MGSSRVYEDMSGQPFDSTLRAASVIEGPPVVRAADAETGVPTERLAAMFDAHADRLYALARRLAVNADSARDLVQETFLRAARSMPSIPVELSKEEAWLVRVLVNIQRDEWRKAGVRERSRALLRESAISDGNVESALIAKRTIWRALDALAPRRRAIIVMCELEGMSIGAIASLLGVTRTTVRWHLSMGRSELKRALAPYMGEET